MNEQAIQDAYTLFAQNGYTKSIDEFKTLINTNSQALQDSYTLFSQNGYSKSIDDFQTLMGVGVKKKEDTVLPSGDGLSVQPIVTPPPNIEEPQIVQPVSEKSETADSTLQIDKPDDPEDPVSIEDISRDEEFIVPELNYRFGNDGFVFEETGLTDNVKVTAVNGNTITIGLDAFTTAGNRRERDRLNDFIKSNKEESVMLQKAQAKYDANRITFKTDQEVQENIKVLNEEANKFAEGVNNYLASKERLEFERQALATLTKEQRQQQKERIEAFNKEQEDLNKTLQKIQAYSKTFEDRERVLQTAVGEYYEMKRKQGSMTAGLVDSFLRGIGEIPAGVVDFALDMQGLKYSFSPSKESDRKIKEAKEKILPSIREFFVERLGGKDVSEQWEQAQQEKFFPGAFLGLARSLPALLSPSKFTRIPALVAQVNSQYQEEFKDLDLTENEKTILKLPLAIGIGLLENLGFRNVITNSGLVKKLVFNGLKKVPTRATPSIIRDAIRNEIKSKLGRAGLSYAGASLAEAETGFMQELTDIGGKAIYEYMTGKELFQGPNSVPEALAEMAYAAGQEAVGGFVLGTLPAISDAYAQKDFTRVDKDIFDMFLKIRNDGVTKKAFVQQLKLQQEKGEITKEQAETQLANFEKAAGLANQVPTDLSPEKQQEVLGLLASKQELVEEKADKDPALVGNINTEIAGIEEDIRKIVEAEKTTDKIIKEEGEVDEKAAPLKTKVEKEQAVDIEAFFGDEVEETTETVTDNLSINRSKKTKTKSAEALGTENSIIKIAQRGAKSISKLLPKTRIILHETTEEFQKFAAPGKGEYDPAADVIHINLEQASITTVPHEIFHAVFLNKVKTDPAAAKLAETMMKSVRKTLPATSELAKRIDTFAESYTDITELQNEERLAELIGIMSSEYKTLSKPNKNKVVKFIENLARQIGVDLKISEFTKTDEDVIDLLNTLAGKVATGEELVETDVQTLDVLDNGTNPIGTPTEIRVPKRRQQLQFKQSYPLSLVTSEKSVDIISLIENIESKNEKVWFWAADQLGLGEYDGVQLDAGPSFALDGEAVWASSKPISEIQKNVENADYLFIVSGSPQKSLLFNKKVYDVFTQKLGDYDTFKREALETKPTKNIRDVLDNHNSWDELRNSPARKTFLLEIQNQESKPNTAFHKYIKGLDGFINIEELRDGFYRENNFEQNDVMVVIKPTGVKEGSTHSTYANEVLGEVVGVPDAKVDAFEIMPKEIADKYRKELTRAEKSQVVAPYGSGIREVTSERLKRKRQQRATEEYISEGREAGFKDTVIIDYLSRVRKVPMREIKSAMEIVSEGLGALPASFKNIRGGAKAGLRLFKKIDRIVKREQKKKTPLAQSQILEKAIEFMQAQPEYKNEADTYTVRGETRSRKGLSTQQMLMEIDLQKTLGLRPTQDMSRKLGIARAAVKQRIKGIRDVQKVKTELKNFMRKTLPARVLLSKDAQKMFRYIERVTPDFMQSTQAQGAKIDNVFREVTDFVAEENNRILEKDIENILNGKYEKTVNNRRVAQKIDADTKARIDSIKKMLPSSNLTPEQINEAQEKLNQEFNKLNDEITGQENPSNETLDRMADLQIAISYANAMVQSNTDPIKTQTLDSIYSQLQSLIEIGSANLKEQLKQAAKNYRAQMAAMYYDITGVRLNPEDDNFKDKLEELENIKISEKRDKQNKNRIINAIKNSFRKVKDSVFGTAEALTGLMDRISSLPGDMMGGISQELVTERINKSSIKYKKRMMAFDAMFQDKLKEYYGKNWKKKAKEFRNTGKLYTITEGRGIYDKLTQDQMYYLYNQYKDPATHPAFKNMFGEDYKKVMENLTKQLKPEVKAFADWQVEEFFPAVYDYYNKTYKEIYRTNMPQNQNYAGRIFREGVTPEPLDLLANSSTFNTQVSAASTLLRSNPSLKITPANGTDALVGYVRDMEYFAAYGVELRDIQKLFGNGFIKSAIKRIHGDQVFGYIENMINKIAGKGIQLSAADRIVNGMTTLFVLARIGLSPLITIKQLTSAVTYANDIGIINWLKYSAKNLPELRKVFKEISDNSVYLQDRGSRSILNQIEAYANTSSPLAGDWIPSRATDFLSDVIMYSTRLGDRGAIYLGGSANYSYYKDQFKKKNPRASEQQAIDYAIKRFERDTKETQQSSDLQDKDLLQNSGAFYRAFNMFLTTPKQYLRKEIIAARNLLRKIKARDLKAGKGTFTENVRQLLMYHVFMPVFFQWVSTGFPMPWGEWDDEDTADMVRAALLGNLNALFLIGEMLTQGADFFQNKPWYKETSSIPTLTVWTNLLVKYDEYDKAKSTAQKQKKLTEFYVELAMFTGLPARNIQKMAENYPKLLESENFGEFMLRLLNYSKYQIEGRPKKKGAKKKPMSMTEMKKFYPEMYEVIKEMEDPELKQLEKDMRELEKEMLESMYE